MDRRIGSVRNIDAWHGTRLPSAQGEPASHGRAVACRAVLRLPYDVYLDLVGLAFDELPNEACGLLGGDPQTGLVERFYRCRNVAESSRIYEVDPKDHLRADRDAEDNGLEIIGVMHSHTHTEAYPSPTDVAQAVDPTGTT